MLRETQLTSPNPVFLPTLLGNEAQMGARSSTHRFGTGGSFSSSLVHHSKSHSTKIATEGTLGKRSHLELALSMTSFSRARSIFSS